MRKRGSAAEQRADRIRWKENSRRVGQSRRNTNQRLREMNERAGVLDKRLLRHGEETASWHKKWDEPSEPE